MTPRWLIAKTSTSILTVKNVALIRRGIAFGPEVTHEEKKAKRSSDDEKLERGLLFVCYQSNLGQGFQFMQKTWANNERFPPKANSTPPVPTPGIDAIIGVGGPGVPRAMVGTDPAAATESLDFTAKWVIPRGGEYFFSPSISALKHTFAARRMSKPYFVFVTGSFAPPSFYDNIVAGITAKGYDIKVLHLPTVGLGPGKGRDGPAAGMHDDAAHIAKEVETLADEGREIILVAHSYGGMPATESTKGLSIKERQAAGKKGGIIRIAYKTVLLTPVGEPASSLFTGDTPIEPPDVRVQISPHSQCENGWLHPRGEPAVPVTFSDLPPDEGREWNKKFAWHSARSFMDPLQYAGYQHIPVSYLLCEKDLVVPPDVQWKGIKMIEEATGGKVDVTKFQTGHCPSASVPEQVIDWFLDVALLTVSNIGTQGIKWAGALEGVCVGCVALEVVVRFSKDERVVIGEASGMEGAEREGISAVTEFDNEIVSKIASELGISLDVADDVVAESDIPFMFTPDLPSTDGIAIVWSRLDEAPGHRVELH
ncbi:dyp-type peroxidase [Lasiodiplodia mahajangana]|uniref:Dyp-type peroxidase n=1 Tax=Lasiodiplodia mahajangana TaxID=1108764 RepID=A0ACC2JCM8_9PEZI|nr:dyp-type peroxidase [Lasiodiplodia mahajangana]